MCIYIYISIYLYHIYIVYIYSYLSISYARYGAPGLDACDDSNHGSNEAGIYVY